MDTISIQPVLIFIITIFIIGLIKPKVAGILSLFLIFYLSLRFSGPPSELNGTKIFFSFLLSLGFSVLTFNFFKHLKPPVEAKTTKDENNLKPSSPAIKAPSTSISKKPAASIDIDKSTEKSYFEYDEYYGGHTESTWESIGLTIGDKHRSFSRNYYTFKETEPKGYSKYGWLTPNQRKVKILGDALVRRTSSKRLSKDILVNQYSFNEETAKYAVGYEGYHDW